ncbi:hypothetical protein TNCV_2031951 [Trichonephila clavipes]|nr:hypothetical protein TNCV_2031951 [Trichonephila clavipes]
MNRVVLRAQRRSKDHEMVKERCVAKIKKRKTPERRDGSAHHKRLQYETKKNEKEGVPTDHREKTQQGGPVRSRKAEKGTIVHTSKSEKIKQQECQTRR